jgi:cysteine desulfurase/selenocysteine lyase
MKEGDEVIISTMEHHSNIVPWQLLAARKGISIKVIPMNDRGELLLDEYEKLFSDRTRIVSIAHISNVLGTINPVKEMIATAHAHGFLCWLTVRNLFLTCKLMCKTLTLISLHSPVIKCTDLPA